jgi:hypothetical protein
LALAHSVLVAQAAPSARLMHVWVASQTGLVVGQSVEEQQLAVGMQAPLHGW